MLCVRLTKIKENKPPKENNDLDGMFLDVRVGDSFYLKDMEHTDNIKVGKRIVSSYLITTEVLEVLPEEKRAIIKTQNSTYQAELVELSEYGGSGRPIVHYWK